MGILTALLEREQSGEGQWVQTSLLQAQIFMLDFQAARWLIGHEVPKQAGNNHPTSIPTGVYTTADGHINVATTGGRIWERFCQALDSTDLVEHPDYKNNQLRSKNRDVLNAELNRRFVKRTSAEWIDRLNEAGVPCGPIYSIDEVFADPQVQHLGIAQDVPKQDGGALAMVGQPFTMSRTPSRMAAPPPAMGEHTDEVMAEFGFTPAEVAEYRKTKVI
jgi:formyl-CoA transferase